MIKYIGDREIFVESAGFRGTIMDSGVILIQTNLFKPIHYIHLCEVQGYKNASSRTWYHRTIGKYTMEEWEKMDKIKQDYLLRV